MEFDRWRKIQAYYGIIIIYVELFFCSCNACHVPFMLNHIVREKRSLLHLCPGLEIMDIVQESDLSLYFIPSTQIVISFR